MTTPMRFSLRGSFTIITLIALGCGLAVSFHQNRKLKAEKAEEKAEQVKKMNSLEVQLSRSRLGGNLGFSVLAELALSPEHSDVLDFLNSVDQGGLAVEVFPFEPIPSNPSPEWQAPLFTWWYIPQIKGDRKKLSLIVCHAYPRKPGMDLTKPLGSYHWDNGERSKWKYAYLIVENDTLKIRDVITVSGWDGGSLGTTHSHPKSHTSLEIRLPDGSRGEYVVTESGFELVQ